MSKETESWGNMSQAIFDALTGNVSMDNQTALVVQSLLDAQNVPETTQVEEEDLFQCGKCKKQFTTLQNFIGHKQVQCSPPPLVRAVSQATSINNNQSAFTSSIQQVQQHQQSMTPLTAVAPSPITQLAQGVVLSEDLLTFANLDHNLQSHTIQMTFQPATQVQGNPFLSQVASLTPRGSSANSVTIYSPLPSSTYSTNGSTFTSTIPANQIQVHPQQPTLSPSEKSTQPKPSPTKAGRKSAQSFNQLLMSDYVRPSKGKKGKGCDDGDDKSGKKKLRCQFCTKTFTKNFDLQQHVRCHTGEKPFQCIVCGRAFAQKSNVKKHMTTHKVWPAGSASTLPKPTRVVLVEDEMSGITQCISTTAENTEEVNHNPQPIRKLNIGSGTDDNGHPHVVVDNSYLCQYCPEKFKTYFQLKSHMTVHKEEQVYKCVLKTCGETFRDLDAYLEHIKTHEDGMSYRCHLCSKTFQSLFELGEHQYSHSLYPSQNRLGVHRYYQCNKCLNKYSSPEALDHHLSTSSHHYQCPKCPKIFTCERYLRRHLAIHGTTGQVQCPVCFKRFKAESYLKLHSLIHTGKKPFVCERCDAAFNRKDKLKRHMLIHEQVKKFKCPFRMLSGCEMEFNRPDKLKAHIISHSGIKPFKCKECGKAFSRKPSLNEHERTHRADFRFSCEKCGKGFFRPKLFKSHKCNPIHDKDGSLIVPSRRVRAHKKVGRPKKRMITVTQETIKSVSTALSKRRGRRPGRNMTKEKSVEPSDPVLTTNEKTVNEQQQIEVSTEIGHMSSQPNSLSNQNVVQSDSMQVNPPIVSLSTNHPQPAGGVPYTTVHCLQETHLPSPIYTGPTIHLQSHPNPGEIIDGRLEENLTTLVSADHDMSNLVNHQHLNHVPIEIIHITPDGVQKVISTSGLSDSNTQIVMDTGCGPMETTQTEYHLVPNGCSDDKLGSQVLFTSGDVITCVTEGTSNRFVADIDPVLQGTENMLRASEEILRSAEHQVTHCNSQL